MKDCLIIGAGVAGLTAARRLAENGIDVTVLDKGRTVGGRMATRRTDSVVFDHGAQFITVRHRHFSDMITAWIRSGVVHYWADGFPGPGETKAADGHPRYRGADGMNAVPRFLARDLNVHLSTRVTAIEHNDSGWTARTSEGMSHSADSLIMTPPIPQSLALLEAGGVQLDAEDRRALESIAYDPCLAVLLTLAEPTSLPDPGGVRGEGEPIQWIADNQLKGISPKPSVTIHAGPEYSRLNWDRAEEEVVREILEAAAWLKGMAIVHSQLHRWRYSQPTHLYPERCLLARTTVPLVFAGDAFKEPRVEGAALSGLEASKTIRNL